MEMVHFIPSSQRRLAMLAAQADHAPVLICGASGTGKGAISRWIHANSARAAGAFFTADPKSPLAPQIAPAQGGTLMVPDISEWPMGEQKMLADFLRTKSFVHQGIRSLANVRIIATSSYALEGRTEGGLFNSELMDRLKLFKIEMPPLRKRNDEFEDIVLAIIGEITRDLHKEHLKSGSAAALSDEAWDRLIAYDWPGNIRELRNVLKLAVVSAKGDRIEAADLPDFGYERIDLRATREQFEKIYLLELLKTCDWEIDKTSKASRIDPTSLLAKIKHYGIRLDGQPQGPATPTPAAD